MSLAECLAKTRVPSTAPETPPSDEGASTPPTPRAGAPAVYPGAGAAASEKPQQTDLILRFWNQQGATLSWAYYIELFYYPAQSLPESDGASSADAMAERPLEQVVIIFAQREVVLLGRNLEQLINMVARRRIFEIREVPEKYLTSADRESGLPLIVRMELRERSK